MIDSVNEQTPNGGRTVSPDSAKLLQPNNEGY